MDLLLERGALDVFLTPIHMKKNRSTILLTVLTTTEEEEYFAKLFFKHTSTIGIRSQTMERSVMDRPFKILETPFGKVCIKRNHYHGLLKESIEYQDCERIAKQYNFTIEEVYCLVQALNSKTID